MKAQRLDSGGLERSQLYVSASNWHMIEKASANAADAVVIDLENPVVAAEKVTSRANVIRAFRDLYFGAEAANLPDQRAGHAAGRGDLVMLPKTNAVRDIHFVETLLEGIGQHGYFGRSIGIEAQIETAAETVNLREIASASPRLETLIFGPGGKQCIHPEQLDAVNAAFSPSQQDTEQARAVLDALEQARLAGRGAVSLNGRMVDAANIRLGQTTLNRVNQIQAREAK